MRLSGMPDIKNVTDIPNLIKFLAPWVKDVSDCLTGKVGFTDNIQLNQISVSFAAANTNVATNHDLKAVPMGYIVIGKTAGIHVFDGTSGNTASVINLQASGAGTARLIIF